MSHQMNSKNGCHGRYSFEVFRLNLFNGKMNRFESKWFIAIIGDVYRLVLNETSHLYISVKRKFPSIKKEANIVLQYNLSAVDAAKQHYKIIWS